MKKNTKASFDNDYFGRKKFAENLYQLLRNQHAEENNKNEECEKIRVISIKSDFGYGKTYFAKSFQNMINDDEENRNPYLCCHYIDIWKEDYNHNPLLALLSSLDDFLGTKDFLKPTTKNKIKDAGKMLTIEVLKEGVSKVPFFGKGASKGIDTFLYYDDKNIFKDLNALKKVATKIKKAFEEFKNTQMIIIIDEIDRCYPEYAIEFLETLKHFFDVDNLYFIVMMNENHIKEKIKEKFKYIDFNTWKDKFINLEFELPNAKDQESFLKYLMDKKCKTSEVPNINIKKINLHQRFNQIEQKPIQMLKEIEDSSLSFFSNQTYSWNHLLIVLSKSANINLNNRQLVSISSHLEIALKILKNKPIYPLLLLGTILKNYFPLENIQCNIVYDDFLGAFNNDGIQTQYFHYLTIIASLKPTTEQQEVVLYGRKGFVYLNYDEIENILSAQFASQGSM